MRQEQHAGVPADGPGDPEIGRAAGARLDALTAGIRRAARRIRRSPGFALSIVLSFALGIGANAAMFGVVDRLLLSPPPHVAGAEQVRRLMIDRLPPETGIRQTGDVLSYLDYEDFTAARAFSAVAAVNYRTLTVGRGAEARQQKASLVTGGYFSVLGVRPALGRFFGPDDDRPGAPGVAVIGYEAWRRDHASDPGVVGGTVDFGYGPYTIVGVAPEGFTGMDLRPVELWLPLRAAATQMMGTSWTTSRNLNMMRAVARLAPGASAQAAEAEATALHLRGRGEQIQARDYDPTARVVAAPLIAARGPLATAESRVAKWLAGISLLVLLIACANVANLLLARSIRRRREVGIQLALGGSRGRVLGEILAESLLLAALGGVVALGLARAGGTALHAILLPDVPWPGGGASPRALGFAAALALLAGLAGGVIPALQAGRLDVAETLKGAGTRISPASRTRSALVVAQVALSVVLLVAAGLFVRSLHRVGSLDLGLDADRVLFVNPVFDRDAPDERRVAFFRAAAERLEALPEVERASVDISIPFWSAMSVGLRVPGLDSVPTLPTGGPTIHLVDHDYFGVLGMRIVRGRGLQPGDNRRNAPPVAVVNETMARVLWPGEGALGRCLVVDEDPDTSGEPPCATVVGVVENARRSSLVEEETMQYYFPAEQGTVDYSPQGLLLRARGDVGAAVPAVQRALLELEPGLRFPRVQSLRELIEPETRPWKLGAAAFTGFGLVALLVAALGLYSMLAFNVAQRTFELGIRAALGASRGRLVRMVLWQSMRLVALSLALGLVIALAAAPRVEALLFEVSPRDPVTLALVALSLLVVAFAAAAIPARRATSVDPTVAFRAE